MRNSFPWPSPGWRYLDTSPPDGPGHLCVLIAGPEARNIDKLSDTDRRSTILRTLAAHLGTGALEPGAGTRSRGIWTLVGGGYVALPIIGRTDGLLPVSAEPTGHIHWEEPKPLANTPATSRARSSPVCVLPARYPRPWAVTQLSPALMRRQKARIWCLTPRR
jgi:hypothetical protein